MILVFWVISWYARCLPILGNAGAGQLERAQYVLLNSFEEVTCCIKVLQ
jgi:hypothetical protein